MRALNPFTGEFYRETLHISRMTREMFCLMEGRHVHPSTLYPGGVGTVPTVQLFTDYLVRLMRYVEFMKKCLPLHDDLFNFLYEALPGYEEVGRRRILLGCWGSFNNPDVCDYTYKHDERLGQRDVCHARHRRRRPSSSPPTWSTSISGIRILLGSSYYDDWENQRECSSSTIRWATRSTSGIPGTRRPFRARKSATSSGKYTWVMSPRWYDKRTRRSPGPRHRRRPDRPVVGHGTGRQGRHRLRQGHGPEREDLLAQDGDDARSRIRMEDPQVEQRHRARPCPDVLPGLRRGDAHSTLPSRR